MSKTKPYLNSFPEGIRYKLYASSANMGRREMQRLQKLSWRKKTNAYKTNNMSINH